MTSHSPKTALVLTGGGARGAYQAGVLRGIAELLGPDAGSFPFSILTGVSAGAINASFLAAQPGAFDAGARALCELWATLQPKSVIKTDALTIGKLGARWFRDLTSGGSLGRERITHLLDSSPLRKFLGDKIDFEQIQRNIRTRGLRAVSCTATNYTTGTAMTFFDGEDDIAPWTRSARLGKRERLGVDHVLASAAIPIFFGPVRLGNAYFGDGGIRMGTPLSPAIHLGAERILAVGIRYCRPNEEVYELNEAAEAGSLTLADIAGVLLNALFLDALDADAERLLRINQTVELLHPERLAAHPYHLRRIPFLALRPSRDLGALAADQFDRFPRILRYLLKGMGAGRDKGWDLLSYLAFDASYTTCLIEVGYEDALRQRREIEAFFAGEV